jgi:hypothetical protein
MQLLRLAIVPVIGASDDDNADESFDEGHVDPTPIDVSVNVPPAPRLGIYAVVHPSWLPCSHAVDMVRSA